MTTINAFLLDNIRAGNIDQTNGLQNNLSQRIADRTLGTNRISNYMTGPTYPVNGNVNNINNRLYVNPNTGVAFAANAQLNRGIVNPNINPFNNFNNLAVAPNGNLVPVNYSSNGNYGITYLGNNVDPRLINPNFYGGIVTDTTINGLPFNNFNNYSNYLPNSNFGGYLNGNFNGNLNGNFNGYLNGNYNGRFNY